MTSNRPQGFRDSKGGNFPPPPKLPTDYLQKGYFDDKGNPLPEIIIDWPKAIADTLSGIRPPMSSSQLRGAFFTEVRRLEKRLDATHDFNAIRPEILKLRAFAADRRKKRKIPLLFEEFIEANLRWATRGEKEFRKGFVPHFECVVAYYPEIRGQ